MKRFHFKVLFMALFTAIFLASIPLFCIVSNAAYQAETNLKFLVAAENQTEGAPTLTDSKGNTTSSAFSKAGSGEYLVSKQGIHVKRAVADFTSNGALTALRGNSFTVELYIQDFAEFKGDELAGSSYTQNCLFASGKYNTNSNKDGAKFAIYYDSTDKSICILYGSGSKYKMNKWNGVYSDEKEFMQDSLITVTYSGGTLQTYINGIIIGDKTGLSDSLSDVAWIAIGDSGGWASDVIFKNIRIYNTALDQTQILTNYETDRGNYAKDCGRGYYDFGYDHEGHLKAFFGGINSIDNSSKWKNLVDDALVNIYFNDSSKGYLNPDGSYTVADRHSYNSGTRVNFNEDTSLKSVFNKSSGDKAFTVELKLSNFAEASSKHECLFYLTKGSSDEKEFILYYDKVQDTLGLKYNSDASSENQIRITKSNVSANQLKNALISITYEQSEMTKSRGATKDNFIQVCLYLDGELLCSFRGEQSEAATRYAWDNIRIGTDWTNSERDASCTYQYIRFYDAALTQEQIRQNFALDTGKYENSSLYTATKKGTAYYGITGFDKIIHATKKLGSSFNISGTENELNEDWIMSDFKNDDFSNKLYVTMEAGNYIDEIESSAHFIDMGYATNESGRDKSYLTNTVRNKSYIESRVGNADILLSKIDTEYAKDEHNAVLLADNSFFLKNKFKCGAGAFNGNVAESPRLMVTADICAESVQDTDFCGIVIDYSDEIYKKYDKSATQMYTAFDEDKKSSNDYSHSALFPTGVGFTIAREQNQYGVDKNDVKYKAGKDSQGNSYDKHIPIDKNKNNDYLMRVFVAGTGKAHGASNAKDTVYYDVPLTEIFGAGFKLNGRNFHNYTIYRNYEKWTYNEVITYQSGSITLKISPDDFVYIVRFFVDKKLVAIVAMKVEPITVGDTTKYIMRQNRGGIFTFDETTGTVSNVLETPKGEVCTFGDWARVNRYGDEGTELKVYTNGDTDENNKYIGSPSGNILVGLHRENRFILNNGQIAEENDETLCKVYFDNIGYMDYNDQLTKDTYSSNVSLNADMTVNVRSTIAHQYPVKEPVVKFNRLAYNSSLILDSFAQGNAKLYKIPYYTNGNTVLDTRIQESLKFSDVNSPDYKASHGTSYLVGDRFLSTGAIRDKALDGIYFKDICDTLTIEVVDFNGVVINVIDDFSVIKYFNNLYDKYKNGGNPDKMNQNQINLMLDIIELGRESHYNSGYFKASRDHMFEFTNDEDSWKNQQNLLASAEKFQEACNGFGEETIESAESIETKISSDAMLTKYVKPRVTKSDPNATYQNTFKNYNISIKSYIGLVVNINFRQGTNISNYLKITDSKGNEIAIRKLSDLATYNDEVNNPFFDVKDGVVSVEIPLKIENYDEVFTFKLYSLTESERTDQTPYMELQYSLNKYAAAMWSNTSNNIDDFVKRLYHIEVIANYFNEDEEFNFAGIPA